MNKNEKKIIREDINKLIEILNSRTSHIEIPAWKSAADKFQLKSFLLAEAYARNDDIDWLAVFEMIKKVNTHEISNQECLDYLDELGICFKIIPEKGKIGGVFNLSTGTIIMQVSQDIIEDIAFADKKQLKKWAKNFWTNFCHEDTHRQQHAKAGKYYSNGKYSPPTNQYWDENEVTDKDFDYFNQVTEADAYGREIAARLRGLHPRKSVSSLFMSVTNNNIKDKYCRGIINIYRDPRISDQANHSFFRALYDYLEGNEEGLNESF